MVATNSVYRCSHIASAVPGSCVALSAGPASAQASTPRWNTAVTRSERRGKCRYSVPTPTPARSAISLAGACTPEARKTVRAASSRASILRCASARSRRGPGPDAPGPAGPAGSSLFSAVFSGTTLLHLLFRKGFPYSSGRTFRLAPGYGKPSAPTASRPQPQEKPHAVPHPRPDRHQGQPLRTRRHDVRGHAAIPTTTMRSASSTRRWTPGSTSSTLPTGTRPANPRRSSARRSRDAATRSCWPPR